jgi:hypothetical protein
MNAACSYTLTHAHAYIHTSITIRTTFTGFAMAHTHTHTHNYVHNDKHTYRLELWHGEDTLELLESVAGILPEHMLI